LDAQDNLELRRTAGGLMPHERPGHTLRPSALVHEALLQPLGGDPRADVPDRRRLFAAAPAMRQVFVDPARLRQAAARDPGRARVPPDEALAYFQGQRLDVVARHEGLDRPAREHPRPAPVVALRFCGGRAVPEVAAALGVSVTTVEADRRFARAWPH